MKSEKKSRNGYKEKKNDNVIPTLEENQKFIKNLSSLDSSFSYLTKYFHRLSYLDFKFIQKFSNTTEGNGLLNFDSNYESISKNLIQPVLLPVLNKPTLLPLQLLYPFTKTESGKKSNYHKFQRDRQIDGYKKISSKIDTLVEDNSNDNKNKNRLNIHSDSEAQYLAQLSGVDAFTTGGHIFFAKGKYDPKTPKGIALIAHELTHVKQQQNLKFPLTDKNNFTKYRFMENEAITNEKKVLSFFSKFYKYYFALLSNINNLKTRLDYNDKKYGFENNNFSNYYKGTKIKNPIMNFRETVTDPILEQLILPSIKNLTSLSKMKKNFEASNNKELNRNSFYKKNIDSGNMTIGSPYRFVKGNDDDISIVTKKMDLSQSIDSEYIFYKPNTPSPPPPQLLPPSQPLMNKNNSPVLFAEKNRSLGTELSVLENIENNTIQPKTTSTNISNNTNSIIDTNLIAAKVYEIIQEKIKMERAQRGIR